MYEGAGEGYFYLLRLHAWSSVKMDGEDSSGVFHDGLGGYVSILGRLSTFQSVGA